MLLKKLLSRIEFKDHYPRKHPKSAKAVLQYSFVSTKVVSYKDEAGVMREAIVGITYVKAKE